MKQIILMRTDLGMTPGKMISQGAHASLKATIENQNDYRVKYWLYNDRFTKIALAVNSPEELYDIVDRAKLKGMITSVIIDEGLTVFDGVPTLTCAAIGPDEVESFIGVTDHLKLVQ